VGLAVAENSGEGRKVNAIGNKVHGLNSRNRSPEKGIHTAGVNPRVEGGNPGRLAIDADFCFAKSGAASALRFAEDSLGTQVYQNSSPI
jgi:hypothetical protein